MWEGEEVEPCEGEGHDEEGEEHGEEGEGEEVCGVVEEGYGAAIDAR